ncbi:MAG: undecaprenyl diphosphate synthase family protein, partial [Methanomicrobiaceae archaeon]|nr:undecaprenyl diphosphate synthase family protein [Methanomicrobiaceae archaeon]
MIRWIYEHHLKRSIHTLPRHICFMIDGSDMIEAPRKIVDVASWCRQMKIPRVTFHMSTPDPGSMDAYLPMIREIGEDCHLTIYYGDCCEECGEGIEVVVAIGMSGREEITHCIRDLAAGDIAPEEVDEEVIENHLKFRYEPDLVIKTGGDHLTDFLIWQSVYSELFFSDVNWKFFRKIDFLRALRDFQFR